MGKFNANSDIWTDRQSSVSRSSGAVLWDRDDEQKTYLLTDSLPFAMFGVGAVGSDAVWSVEGTDDDPTGSPTWHEVAADTVRVGEHETVFAAATAFKYVRLTLDGDGHVASALLSSIPLSAKDSVADGESIDDFEPLQFEASITAGSGEQDLTLEHPEGDSLPTVDVDGSTWLVVGGRIDLSVEGICEGSTGSTFRAYAKKSLNGTEKKIGEQAVSGNSDDDVLNMSRVTDATIVRFTEESDVDTSDTQKISGRLV